MKHKRQIIPIAGLVVTVAMAVYVVVQLKGQATTPSGDFSSAAVAEVHDGRGQALLRGEFAVAGEADDDIERRARLESTGIDTDATGEAEVELSKQSPAHQDVQFSIHNLQPGTTLTFFIDGRAIGHTTVDGRGRAEMEVRIEGSRSTASR